MLGNYGALIPEFANRKWKECNSTYRASPETVAVLTKLKEYHEHFRSQEWYKNNREELEGYPILAIFTEKLREVVGKTWAGDVSVLR